MTARPLDTSRAAASRRVTQKQLSNIHRRLTAEHVFEAKFSSNERQGSGAYYSCWVYYLQYAIRPTMQAK